jgi:S-adenosylmethionine:tRNA ribosyltransferase-isomerase
MTRGSRRDARWQSAKSSRISFVLVKDFNFYLPEELIAQQPPTERSGSRMLHLDRASGVHEDRMFVDLPSLLKEGDLLVLNNSRVIPARLFARRMIQKGQQPPTGEIEVLLTEQISEWEWRALVRPGRKVGTGERLLFQPTADTGDLALEAEVTGRGEFGERTLRFVPSEDFFQTLDRLGHVPLPPYIHRNDLQIDRERYQTVYAEPRGSVAAPTAGLHFTDEVFAELKERKVRIAFVTLHVGLGTFAPLRVENVEEIQLHAERYTLPTETAEEVNSALREGRRVVAAGTTTVRTLEHCARESGGDPLKAHSGITSIFLSPGAEFRVVKAILTNFHLPQSSLLMLVSAFAGREQVLSAYRYAVEQRYRFFSYGDCMFLS